MLWFTEMDEQQGRELCLKEQPKWRGLLRASRGKKETEKGAVDKETVHSTGDGELDGGLEKEGLGSDGRGDSRGGRFGGESVGTGGAPRPKTARSEHVL